MQNDANSSQQLVDALMKQLGPDDRKRVQGLLSDKKACEKIINSPEAQKLMREFMGGK